MKNTKKLSNRLSVVIAIMIIISGGAYFFWPEKDPAEAVRCERDEDCELYQCANCANKDDIDDAERGNEGCNPELKVGCGCEEGICRREYK